MRYGLLIVLYRDVVKGVLLTLYRVKTTVLSVCLTINRESRHYVIVRRHTDSLSENERTACSLCT